MSSLDSNRRARSRPSNKQLVITFRQVLPRSVAALCDKACCLMLQALSVDVNGSSCWQTKPQRPLTARADMRRGFTINPRRRLIEAGRWGDTPGPAGYLPHSAGDLATKVGQGKNVELGHRVRDSLCWAGSALTTRGAFISVAPSHSTAAEASKERTVGAPGAGRLPGSQRKT